MIRHAISPRLATRMVRNIVMPGLVPSIQPSACAGACCTMDPGNKCRDDDVGAHDALAASDPPDPLPPRRLAFLEKGTDAFLGIAGQRRREHVRGFVEHRTQPLA